VSENIETKIRECLARAYTTKDNSSKEVDVTLMEAMAEEVMNMLDKPLPETVVLAYESFPSGKSVADLLDALIIREGKKWR
jgi:hypothetical protein